VGGSIASIWFYLVPITLYALPVTLRKKSWFGSAGRKRSTAAGTDGSTSPKKQGGVSFAVDNKDGEGGSVEVGTEKAGLVCKPSIYVLF
jgi:hypothetical protein